MHEEADTRQLIHFQDALDTDVIVILIGKFHQLINLCEGVNIWVAFGTGENFTYHHINAIYGELGRVKSLALPVASQDVCDTKSARNLRDSPGFLEFVPGPGTLRELSRKSAYPRRSAPNFETIHHYFTDGNQIQQ